MEKIESTTKKEERRTVEDEQSSDEEVKLKPSHYSQMPNDESEYESESSEESTSSGSDETSENPQSSGKAETTTKQEEKLRKRRIQNQRKQIEKEERSQLKPTYSTTKSEGSVSLRKGRSDKRNGKIKENRKWKRSRRAESGENIPIIAADRNKDEEIESENEFSTATSEEEEESTVPYREENESKEKHDTSRKSRSEAAEATPSQRDNQSTHYYTSNRDVKQNVKPKIKNKQSERSRDHEDSSPPLVSPKESQPPPRERKNRERRENIPGSSTTDESSSESDVSRTLTQSETRALLRMFESYFGRLCYLLTGIPGEVAVELQKEGLITISTIKDILDSPESKQSKAIALVDALQERIKSRPDRIFSIVRVFIRIATLEEIGREMMTETERICPDRADDVLDKEQQTQNDLHNPPLSDDRTPPAVHIQYGPQTSATESKVRSKQPTTTTRESESSEVVSGSVPESELSPELTKYRQYLQSVYRARKLAAADKYLPTLDSPYINLAMINRGSRYHGDRDEFTRQTLHGGVDQIFADKIPISIEDLLVLVKKKGLHGESYEGGFVLVEGPPGIGKSTFCWELCRRWNEIESLRKFLIILLLKLREKWVSNATSLADLFRYEFDPKLSKRIAQLLSDSSGRSLLLILDGFDEVSHSFHEDSVIKSILCRRLLPECTIILTTRPSAKATLHSICRPRVDKHVEIIGFTEEERVRFVTEVFSMEPELQAIFLKYMFLIPHIKSMMYIPLNCAIVAQVYYESQSSRHLAIPRTRTQLYKALTHSLLVRHMKMKEDSREYTCMLPEGMNKEDMEKFRVLAKFAFDTYHKKGRYKRITFFSEDVPEGFVHFGMMNESSEMYAGKGVEKTFSFLHLCLQEYLAAWHLAHNYSSEFHVAYHQLVLRVSPSVRCNILYERSLIQSLNPLVISLVEPAIFLAGITGMRQQSVDDDNIWEIYLSQDFDVRDPGLLFRSLYEAQNPAIVSSYFMTEKRRNININSHFDHYSTLTPYDCYALSYCVSNASSELNTLCIGMKDDLSKLEPFSKGLSDHSITSHVTLNTLIITLGSDSLAVTENRFKYKILQFITSLLEVKEFKIQWSISGSLETITVSNVADTQQLLLSINKAKSLLRQSVSEEVEDSTHIITNQDDILGEISIEEAEERVKVLLGKEGEIKQRNLVVVITGLMESGKTTLLHHLFGKPPPEKYTSTRTTEKPWRGLTHHTLDGTLNHNQDRRLKFIETKDMLERVALAKIVPEEIPRSSDDSTISTSVNVSDAEMESDDEVDFEPPAEVIPKEPTVAIDETPTVSLSRNEEESGVPTRSMVLDEVAEIICKNPNKFYGELELVHMIDTGGQPECLEVLPSLLHNAHIILLLVDLSKGLEEETVPTLHEENEAFKKQPLITTNRQLIMQLGRTMTGRGKSKIIVIGTHKDRVPTKDLPDIIHDLSEDIKTFLPTEAVQMKENKCVLDVDLTAPPEDMLECVIDFISEYKIGAVPVPCSYVFLERELLLSMESERERRKVKVMKLSECVKVAKSLDLDRERVFTALKYFDKYNIVLFFDNIGEGLMFCRPEDLLAFFNRFLYLTYSKRGGTSDVMLSCDDVESLSKGIITSEIFKKRDMEDMFVRSVFEASHAIEIFKRAYIIAEIKLNSEYIMMCLLPHLSKEEFKEKYNALIEGSVEIEPLYIIFMKDEQPSKVKLCCSPSGSFGNTIAFLLSNGWMIQYDKKNKNPEFMYHQIVALVYKGVSVTLIDRIEYFEVFVTPDEDKYNILPKIRHEIIHAVQEILKLLSVKIIPAEAFECVCGKKCVFHTKVKLATENEVFTCSLQGSETRVRNCWIEGNGYSPKYKKDCVNFQKLRIVTVSGCNICLLDECAEKYNEIGELIFQNADIVAAILDKAGNNNYTAIRMLFARWIRESEDPSWKELNVYLEKLQLGHTLSDVQERAICQTGLEAVEPVEMIPKPNTHTNTYPSINDSGECPEITKVRENLTLITRTVTVGGSPQHFANKLVEKAFLPHHTAQQILNALGSTPDQQASKLIDSVFAKIECSESKEELFKDFVDIFSSEPANEDLVEKFCGTDIQERERVGPDTNVVEETSVVRRRGGPQQSPSNPHSDEQSHEVEITDKSQEYYVNYIKWYHILFVILFLIFVCCMLYLAHLIL